MYITITGATMPIEEILTFMGFRYWPENNCWFVHNMPEWEFEIIFPQLMRFEEIEVNYEY